MGKPKVLELTEAERLALEKGFRLGEKHSFRMRCRAVLLKADGLSSAAAGVQTEMSHVSVNAWVKRFKSEGIDGLNTRSGRGRKPIMDLFGRGSSASCNRARQTEREQDKSSIGASLGQRGKRLDIQTFFISIGARYKRIRKRPGEYPRRNSMNTKSRSCKNLKVKRLKDVLGSIMLMRATLVLKDMSLTVGNCKGRMFMSPPKGWHDSISLE